MSVEVVPVAVETPVAPTEQAIEQLPGEISAPQPAPVEISQIIEQIATVPEQQEIPEAVSQIASSSITEQPAPEAAPVVETSPLANATSDVPQEVEKVAEQVATIVENITESSTVETVSETPHLEVQAENPEVVTDTPIVEPVTMNSSTETVGETTVQMVVETPVAVQIVQEAPQEKPEITEIRARAF